MRITGPGIQPKPYSPPKPTTQNTERRFKASSESFERDAFLAVTTLTCAALPGRVGVYGGLVAGGVCALAGLAELREGVRARDTHQVVDATMHMLSGGMLAAVGGMHNPVLAPWMTIGSLGLLGTKGIIDHPKGLGKFVAHEGGGLISDGMRGLGLEMSRGWDRLTGRGDSSSH